MKPGQDFLNTLTDNFEILGSYMADAEPRIVGVCVNIFKDPWLLPYNEYYVPFMKVETHDTPFTSRYYSEPLIGAQMKASSKALEVSSFMMSTNWKAEKSAYQHTGFNAPSKVSKEALKSLDKLDPKYFRWRGGNMIDGQGGYTGGGITEGHLFDTHFTNLFKGLFTTKVNPVLPWCHRGAVETKDKKKLQPIQPYFSEFVLNGLFGRTYAMLGYASNVIKKYSTNPGAPRNCYMRNLNPEKGGQTHTDFKMPNKWKGQDSDKRCDGVNFNDTIAGRTGNTQKNLYPLKRSELMHLWTWLYAKYFSLFLPSYDNKNIPFITRSEKEDAYKMRHHKRSKWKWLTKNGYDPELDKVYKKNKPNKQEYYLTKESGMDYTGDEVGIYKPEHNGHHYTYVVYSAVRCCPEGYVRIGPGPEVTFPNEGKLD